MTMHIALHKRDNNMNQEMTKEEDTPADWEESEIHWELGKKLKFE